MRGRAPTATGSLRRTSGQLADSPHLGVVTGPVDESDGLCAVVVLDEGGVDLTELVAGQRLEASLNPDRVVFAVLPVLV